MAAKEGKSGDWGAHRAAIVNISSGLGSIADNTMGSKPFGILPYRMSKVGEFVCYWRNNYFASSRH
jgi:hypothetical protein